MRCFRMCFEGVGVVSGVRRDATASLWRRLVGVTLGPWASLIGETPERRFGFGLQLFCFPVAFSLLRGGYANIGVRV